MSSKLNKNAHSIIIVVVSESFSKDVNCVFGESMDQKGGVYHKWAVFLSYLMIYNDIYNYLEALSILGKCFVDSFLYIQDTNANILQILCRFHYVTSVTWELHLRLISLIWSRLVGKLVFYKVYKIECSRFNIDISMSFYHIEIGY